MSSAKSSKQYGRDLYKFYHQSDEERVNQLQQFYRNYKPYFWHTRFGRILKQALIFGSIQLISIIFWYLVIMNAWRHY
jgi:hypothetical protein